MKYFNIFKFRAAGCALVIFSSILFPQNRALAVENTLTEINLVAAIKKNMGDAAYSKLKDDTAYFTIAKVIKAISNSSSSQLVTQFFSSPSNIEKISEQVLKANWIDEALKEGAGTIPKASLMFLADIVVDASTDLLKENFPDKTLGQAYAWSIKGAYLATKSAAIAGANPAAGAAEYVSGGIQLNVEIWTEVLKSAGGLAEANAMAGRSEAYADLADQTNKAMQRYASASTVEDKQKILGLLKESFDSIRPSSHPVGSIFKTYPFYDAELNQMEKLAISTILDFDTVRFTRVRELFLSGDSVAANKFLTDYFSNSEKDVLLIQLGADSRKDSSIQWATDTMQNQLSAIINGGASHIGSASLYTGYNNQQPNANVNPNNTNNYQMQTGSQQTASATNTQAFQSSDWVMVTGNLATHTGVGNSFGPITAPDGGQIASLNNANVPYTLMTKDFFVPAGVKQVTLTFNGNFVTNEYPQFVGSQFNDYASVKITSPSGNVTPVTAFNQALNSSNFTTVNGLPSPMDSSGGQTGFKASTATINVAGGGKVTVEVKVANVGDTAVPSAVLLNKITVK